jgi:hypothetical protein
LRDRKGEFPNWGNCIAVKLAFRIADKPSESRGKFRPSLLSSAPSIGPEFTTRPQKSTFGEMRE